MDMDNLAEIIPVIGHESTYREATEVDSRAAGKVGVRAKRVCRSWQHPQFRVLMQPGARKPMGSLPGAMPDIIPSFTPACIYMVHTLFSTQWDIILSWQNQ